MERYSDAVINENGRAIAGAQVRILDANGLLASVYSDLAGTSMPNPVMTDSLGRWSFCAPAGMYSAEILLGGTVRYVLRDLALVDPSSDLLVLAANTGAGLIGTSSGQTVQQVTDTNAAQIAANAAAITAQTNALAASGGAALIGVSTGGNLQTKLNSLSTSVAGLSNYTLPVATSSVLGGVKQGTGVSIDGNGVLSVSYTAPIATSTTVGVVKPGSGLVVDGNGVLTATGATTGSVASVNTVLPSGGNVTLNTDNIAESGSPTNKWFTPARVIAAVLTGFSTATNAAVTAADTILAALGKLQAQISSNTTAIGTNTSNIASNTSAISANTTAIATKDASGGYAGLTGYAVNIKNAAGSILSQLASSATAARTWTMPDKSGTVALLTDAVLLKPGMGAGRYYSYPLINTLGSAPIAQNTMYGLPVFISEANTFTKIGINIAGTNGAATFARLGIYNMDADALPTSLVLDAGTVSMATTGDKEIAISVNLASGWYYLAAVCDNGIQQVTRISGTAAGAFVYGGASSSSDFGTAWAPQITQTYGALPGTFGAATFVNMSSAHPLIWVRI